MTTECDFAISRRIAPEVCFDRCPSQKSAGKTGCALHPRSRVQCAHKKTHTSIQVQRRASGSSLRNGITAYFALSPVNGFLATVTCGYYRKLDASTAASGPHDFAVRVSIVRLRK